MKYLYRCFSPRFCLSVLLLLAAPWAQAQLPAPFGNAMVFSGTNQFVTIPNFGSVIPTNEITVEFWAYTTQANGQSAFILNPDANSNRFNAHINYGGPTGSTFWDFGNINSGVGRLGPVNAGVNSVSNWVHYAFVASQSGNSMSIYTNGVLQATKTGMTPFVRGSYSLQIGGTTSDYYHGIIDDFRIWSVARTQAQIQSDLYTPLTGNEANLLIYFSFDNTGFGSVPNLASETAAFSGIITGATSTTSTVPIPTYMVRVNSDSGTSSLRQLIAGAQPGSIIIFTNTLSGGSILLTNGPIVITNTLYIDATSLSAGIKLDGNANSRIFSLTNGSATLTLNSLTLVNGNSSSNLTGGGAIFNGGTLRLTNCALLGNRADFSYGGAIENVSNLFANNCVFTGNRVSYVGAPFPNNEAGGAVDNYQGMATFINCTFTGNRADNALGGGISNDGNGYLSVLNCTFIGNLAIVPNEAPPRALSAVSTTGGGAIANNDASLTTLSQCTFVGNGAQRGGALFNPLGGGSLLLTSCTLAQNSSTQGGDGIFSASGSVSLVATIDANNGFASDMECLSTSVSFTGTNIVPFVYTDGSDTVTGPSPLTSDPLLAPLGDYGGPTLTMPPLPGSPAIDAATTGIFTTTDQRGSLRVIGANADIGAVESGGLWVQNTFSSGANCLRTILGNATNYAGPKIINFIPSLSGSNIALATGLTVTDTNGVTIDATSLPGGIQVSGANLVRPFFVTSNSIVTFRSLTIANGSAPTGNFASLGGGGALFCRGNATLLNCSLLSNSVATGTSYAGALACDQGSVVALTNCTIAFNQVLGTSGFAGAFYNFLATLSLDHCTLVSNTAANVSGGTASGGITTLHATLLQNGNSDFNNASGGVSLGNNFISDGTSSTFTNGVNGDKVGTAASPLNALLAPLGHYGGPTLTLPPLKTSPVIDAGGTTTLAVDQRGYARTAGAAPDIGAVEGIYTTNGPGKITTKVLNGGFAQLNLTNFSGANFPVITATNLNIPSSNWTTIGYVTETGAATGKYQFTDYQAPTLPQRFYRVKSP